MGVDFEQYLRPPEPDKGPGIRRTLRKALKAINNPQPHESGQHLNIHLSGQHLNIHSEEILVKAESGKDLRVEMKLPIIVTGGK